MDDGVAAWRQRVYKRMRRRIGGARRKVEQHENRRERYTGCKRGVKR